VAVGVTEILHDSGSFEDVMCSSEIACNGAKSRLIPVYSLGMIDAVGPRWGKRIETLVGLFMPRCTEQTTLRELEAMASDAERWRYAHALFGRIRLKTLQADAAHNRLLRHQYGFEEICAKTLYNLSRHVPGRDWPHPFDSDSPSWVVPISLRFAEALGIGDEISPALGVLT